MEDGFPGHGRQQQREPVDVSALYKVLELEKGATAAEVKKNFRRLALKKHPDKGGDPEEFKKIQASYEVLSDPEKKEKYDKYGLEGLEENGGGGGEGGADIFDLFFGGGRGGRRQSRAAPGRRKAEDTVHPLKVSLEDLYNGKTAKLAITRNVMKGEPRQCGTCRGQGAVIQMRQIGPGMVQQMQSRCPDCGGTGFSVTMKKERQVLEVNIEKGAKHSTKLRFAAMGNESPNADPGDVIFVLQQKEHNVFKRKGADLLLQRDISLVEALVGFSFTVTQLDGRELLVVSAPGQVVRPEAAPGVPFVMAVADEGMPKAGNPFDKGRLFVLFTIVFPPAHSLSVEKCALLKQALPPPLNNDKYDAEQVEEVVCSEIQLEELGQGQGGGGDEEEEEDERGGGERPVQCQQS
mmetsp:Transcript_3324/g.11697  ORF Transcript_3324/g.11697 Transcript_3324/m.11697 type:complete len:407 (-) Transcript_3324:209-1429(-)